MHQMTRTKSRFWDQVVLLGAALLVCVIGLTAFWVADVYDLGPTWVFFAWNAIVLIPLIGRHFRGHFRKPWFVVFFATWMCVHGLVAVELWRWVWIFYWLPFIGLELILGFAAAYALFGPPEKDGNQRADQGRVDEKT